jgi:hypothetical protein
MMTSLVSAHLVGSGKSIFEMEVPIHEVLLLSSYHMAGKWMLRKYGARCMWTGFILLRTGTNEGFL